MLVATLSALVQHCILPHGSNVICFKGRASLVHALSDILGASAMDILQLQHIRRFVLEKVGAHDETRAAEENGDIGHWHYKYTFDDFSNILRELSPSWSQCSPRTHASVHNHAVKALAAKLGRPTADATIEANAGDDNADAPRPRRRFLFPCRLRRADAADAAGCDVDVDVDADAGAGAGKTKYARRIARLMGRLNELRKENLQLRKQIKRLRSLNHRQHNICEKKKRRLDELERFRDERTYTKRSRLQAPKRHICSVSGGYRLALKSNLGYINAVTLKAVIEADVSRQTIHNWERLMGANVIVQTRAWCDENNTRIDERLTDSKRAGGVEYSVDDTEHFAATAATSQLAFSWELHAIRGDATKIPINANKAHVCEVVSEFCHVDFDTSEQPDVADGCRHDDDDTTVAANAGNGERDGREGDGQTMMKIEETESRKTYAHLATVPHNCAGVESRAIFHKQVTSLGVRSCLPWSPDCQYAVPRSPVWIPHLNTCLQQTRVVTKSLATPCWN